MGLIIRARGYEPLPTGKYRVELTSVERVETAYGERLKWVFRVMDGGGTIVDYSTPSDSPSSKCVEWCTALLNRELQPDEEVDTESLLGRTAIAYVRLKKRNNREYNRIEQLLPDGNPPLAGE
jgi:hypothetical protein